MPFTDTLLNADQRTKVTDYNFVPQWNSGGPFIVDFGWPNGSAGASNPSWRQQVRLRTNAATDYTRKVCTWVSARSSTCRYLTPNTYIPLRHESLLFDPGVGKDTDLYQYLAVAQDRALARYNRKVANLSESWKALVPLLEIRELRSTIKSMSEITIEFVRAFDDIRKKRIPTILLKRPWQSRYNARLREQAQKAWLTYSFGIRPMLSDFNSLCAALAAFFAANPVTARISANGKEPFVIDDDIGDAAGSTFQYFSRKRNRDGYASVKIIGGWEYKLDSANDYELGAHLGLKNVGQQLPSAGWELLPFSWIADYFTTAGDFLDDTFTCDVGKNFYLVKNERIFWRTTATLTPYTPYPAEVIWLEKVGGESVVDCVYFRRSVLTALPPRIFRFKSVDEIGRNSVNRLLNLLSLLKGR